MSVFGVSPDPLGLLETFLETTYRLNPEITEETKGMLLDLFQRGVTLSPHMITPNGKQRSWRMLVSPEGEIFPNDTAVALKDYLANIADICPLTQTPIDEEAHFIEHFFAYSVGLTEEDKTFENCSLLKCLFEAGCTLDDQIDLNIRISFPQVFTRQGTPIPLGYARSLTRYLIQAVADICDDLRQ